MTDEKLYKLYKEIDQEDLIKIAIKDKKRAENSRRELEKTITRNKNKDKEIEKLNKIIEIKNDRIQQLMNRTRNARIDKAIEHLEESIDIIKGDSMIPISSGNVRRRYLQPVLDILKGEDKE